MKAAVRTAFELEAGGLEGFLRLLELRLREPGVTEESLPRRAVCVSDMYDQRSTEIGLACVKRYVRASFLYGEDLVSLQVVSSTGYEYPDPRERCKLVEKHINLLEQVRQKIDTKILDLGMGTEFPVIRGFLHPTIDPRANPPS